MRLHKILALMSALLLPAQLMAMGGSMSLDINNFWIQKTTGGPTQTYNFMTGTLPSGLTLTSSSGDAYYNSSGLLTFAAANSPRFDYNPSTLALNGLLLEQAAANGFAQNINFSSQWTFGNSSVTANAAVSPDGTGDAAKLIDTTGNSSHVVYQGPSCSAGSTYAWSVYAKAAEYNYLVFRSGVFNPGNTNVGFNLTTGAVYVNGTSGATTLAQALPNGWWRLSVIFVCTGNNNYMQFDLDNNGTANGTSDPSFIGTGTSGVYLYGVDLEENNFPTSLIVNNTNSPASRNADNLVASSIPWFNAGQGTIAVTGMLEGFLSGSQSFADFEAPSGTFANSLILAVNSGNAYAYSFAASSEVWNPALANFPNSNTPYGMAMSYKAANYNGFATGGAVQSQASGALPSGIAGLYIGCYSTAGYEEDGWIRRLTYYNTQLTNTQMEALIANP